MTEAELEELNALLDWVIASGGPYLSNEKAKTDVIDFVNAMLAEREEK